MGGDQGAYGGESENPKGYYELIHFDMHGRILNEGTSEAE